MWSFEKLAKEAGINNIDLRKDSKKARDWFYNQAYNTKKATGKNLQKNAGPFENMDNLSINSIGKMYFYAYDPKHKGTLKYYDIFPLVFPIELYKDGFLGINIHYLPPGMRSILMTRISETLNNQKYDNTSKLKINYSILTSASRFKLFKPCVHRYLFSHVRSSFQYIKPVNWYYTALLPTEKFKKKSSDYVWAMSLLSI